MTEQDHIDKIAHLTWKAEKLSRETKRKAKETQAAIGELHQALTDAQEAYQAKHAGIQLRSGGTNKPDPGDGDDDGDGQVDV